MSVAVTLAPGTLAPEGSVMEPLIAPRKVCACKREDKNTNRASGTRNARTLIFFVCMKLLL